MALTPGLTQTELVDEQRFITTPWQIYFRDQTQALADVPIREQVTQIPSASAAIPPTSIAAGPLASGLYRVTAYVRVLTPASSNSSVKVLLYWTDGDSDAGVACFLVLIPALTGNTIDTVGTGTAMIHSGAKQPISYAVEYASAAAGMAYALSVVLERMGGE